MTPPPLQPGARVLDVGCGVGGSTYFISETYNCHVHGLDLSVNNILFALERASERRWDGRYCDVMWRVVMYRVLM